MTQTLQCPSCGAEGMTVIDHGLGETVKFRIEPGGKGFINAKTAGGVLENFGKLMESIARDASWKSEAIMRGAHMDDAGVLEFTVEMVPVKSIASRTERLAGAERTEDKDG